MIVLKRTNNKDRKIKIVVTECCTELRTPFLTPAELKPLLKIADKVDSHLFEKTKVLLKGSIWSNKLGDLCLVMKTTNGKSVASVKMIDNKVMFGKTTYYDEFVDNK